MTKYHVLWFSQHECEYFIILSFQVENILRPFNLTDDDYEKIMGLMLESLNKGLGKETNPTAKVKMYPTYVRTVPDGSGELECW